MEDYAVLSTLDQTMHVVEAYTWGDALARYARDAGLTWTVMSGGYKEQPFEHWTLDFFLEDGTEESTIILRLEDLEVETPHSLPHPNK